MKEEMFCFQCQETVGNTGCTKIGVCGKQADTAGLQDLLVFVTKGLAQVLAFARQEGLAVTPHHNRMVPVNLFVTITNANFDNAAIEGYIKETLAVKKAYLEQLKNKEALSDAALWTGTTREEMDQKAATVGVLSEANENVRSLIGLITYGLKGISAYYEHALVLDYAKESLDLFMQETLATLLNENLSVDQLVALALDTGNQGVEVMALLDEANTTTYGHPEISTVSIGTKGNPGILVSGHDLKDIEMLLEQTEGKGVDIYTHSEMLPAHYYPKLKKFSHLVGNYGNAWWDQKKDFENFNGPILMTTNCIVPPKDSYKNRVFTTGASGFSGCVHIDGDEKGHKDFSQIIQLALTTQPPTEIETGEIVGGFAHNQVFALADKVVDAVKSGAIKEFVVMAGCDGRHKTRSYYTDFAQELPKDTVILTAGCAKYRYNKLNLGDIGGIPRVLDAGQCNDSYSLALIALKLKDVFELEDINDLPIVYNIAWYEQKAVIVLLALLALGVKNIHLGPTLPGFLSPDVVGVLVENFGIGGITSVEEDLKTMLA